jgi:hypothetical protein
VITVEEAKGMETSMEVRQLPRLARRGSDYC